jgi:hypothetical protein
LKRISIALVLGLLLATPAAAEVYVKVDANGNAVGGAIMCDAGTCGAGSQFSQLTLQPGEQYVLQGTGHAGIGNNNPNTQVKVDIETKEWTVTRQVEVKPTEPVVINNQSVISYTIETVQKFTPETSPGNNRVEPIIQSNPTPSPVALETTTATATTDTSTVAIETATATIKTAIDETAKVQTLRTAVNLLLERIYAILRKLNR